MELLFIKFRLIESRPLISKARDRCLISVIKFRQLFLRLSRRGMLYFSHSPPRFLLDNSDLPHPRTAELTEPSASDLAPSLQFVDAGITLKSLVVAKEASWTLATDRL